MRSKFPGELNVDGLRKNLHLVGPLATELADLIERKELKWGQGESLRWSGSRNGWLAERLFGKTSGSIDRLDALFLQDPIAADAKIGKSAGHGANLVAKRLQGRRHLETVQGFDVDPGGLAAAT